MFRYPEIFHVGVSVAPVPDQRLYDTILFIRKGTWGFRPGRSGNFDLYLMNSDGGEIRRLTNDSANERFPVFSPIANQIAFLSNRHNPKAKVYEIYLFHVKNDGRAGESLRLTHDNTQNVTWHCVRRIAFGLSLPIRLLQSLPQSMITLAVAVGDQK